MKGFMLTNKKLIIKLSIYVFVIIAIALYFINPFQTSNLSKWQSEVSEKDYQDAISYLRGDDEKHVATYLEVLNNKNIDPTLWTKADEIAQLTLSDDDGTGIATVKHENDVTFTVDVPKSGYYYISGMFQVEADALNDLTVKVKINNTRQYKQSDTIGVALNWYDSTKDFGRDRYNDEYLPNQLLVTDWQTLDLYDNMYTTSTPLLFEFEQGENTVTFSNAATTELKLKNLRLIDKKQKLTYKEYAEEHKSKASSTDTIEVNAIDYSGKNSVLVRLDSNTSPDASPFKSKDKMLNTVSSWIDSGQSVTYTVNTNQAGMYGLSFHYSTEDPDFDAFRSILINGEIPFQEVSAFNFGATDGKFEVARVGGELPYKFYLKEGENTITIRSEVEPIANTLDSLQLLVDHINGFSLEIKKIVGKDVDEDRTWQITKQLPQTEDNLDAYDKILKYCVIDLSQYSDEKDLSAELSYLRRAIRLMEKISEKPDDLPLYVDELYSGTGSVNQLIGDSIGDLYKREITLDMMYVTNNAVKDPGASIFKKTSNTLSQFFNSFFSDKYSTKKDEDAVDVWVNRPITYVDTMQKMIDSQFTPESGVKVNLSVMPDPNKLILANASGETPDVALGLASYMPYDMAIRGVLQPLNEFDDFNSFASENFVAGSMVPYIYNDDFYAIPETVTFNSLVYRTDVFDSLELEVPDTWDDVTGILPTLQRYGMNFFHQMAEGGSTKWFYQTSPLIYQNGGRLYSEDGLRATIDEKEAVEALKYTSDLFTMYSMPEQVPSFYNDFRYNTLPVGITSFETYISLKVAAPEIAGKWAIAPTPGLYDEETDSVSRWYIGNGTNAAMFKDTDLKDESWEFMKWWMSENTQETFAKTLQSVYGPTFMWLSGNVNAIDALPIDENDRKVIMEQINWLRDVPRTPGQYMLERGISNIWNGSVFQGTTVRTQIDRELLLINREIERKMIEFGYLDKDGNKLKEYYVRDIDWICDRFGTEGGTCGNIKKD